MLMRPPISAQLWNTGKRCLELSYQLKKRCEEENSTISFLLFLLPLYLRKDCLTISQSLISANNINKNISEVEKGVKLQPWGKTLHASGNYFLHWKCLFSLNGIHWSHETKQGERAKLSESNATFAYRGFFFPFTQSWIWSIFFYLF